MNRLIILLPALVALLSDAHAQKAKAYHPFIQPCDCNFKMDSSFVSNVPASFHSTFIFQNTIDSSFKTQCGYLIVPENRKKTSSRMIRLPFIVLKSKNADKKKDPLLFTSGGPGNSSLGWINGIQRSSVIADRDCIAFEQRGTRFAIPYLRLFELDLAMKEAYRKNLPKDSMWIEGVKRYKKKLLQKGIDLLGYNSDETIADIHDLLTVLQIDSVNLIGGSYSGGLMMGVLQKDPKRIRSLVLDSPLPMFTPIDEDEPVNFHEAFKKLSEHAEKDSVDKEQYSGLYKRFQDYFNSILNKKFVLPYYDSAAGESISIEYTKDELLDVIVGSMLNNPLKEVPFIVTEIIQGNQEKYVRPKIERILNGYPMPDGMRMTVYCADQANYHNEKVIQQLYKLYPYMNGYHINDVWKAVCDCWMVPPVHPSTKQAFYSDKPVLIADGEMDAACRPLYMLEIKHFMPNAQTFLFINRGHGVGGRDFNAMAQKFLDNPFQKIDAPGPNVVSY
jgi:pimeloyl-ACP methyl ester carboxylesterase